VTKTQSGMDIAETWAGLAFIASLGACAPAAAHALAEPDATPLVVVAQGDAEVSEVPAADEPEPAPHIRAELVLRPNGGGTIPLYSTDATQGDDRAPVTLVVFIDYECPPCARALPGVMGAAKQLGPEALRVVHKHFPLKSHPHARMAAEAVVAVWHLGGHQAHDAFQREVFADQGHIDPTHLREWAEQAGVRRHRLEAFLREPVVGAQVDRDIALAEALDVAGVPAAFMNCRELDIDLGNTSLVVDAVEAERRAIDEALRRGLARDAIYEARCDERTKDR
jgi:protein-disulfide isomerase